MNPFLLTCLILFTVLLLIAAFMVFRGIRRYGNFKLWLNNTLGFGRQRDARTFTPCIAEGVMYFGSNDGHLYAVDMVTRREKWRYALGARITAAPTYDSGTVYICGWDGALHAVDAQTGVGRWRFRTQSLTLGTPTILDGVAYFGSEDFYFYAVETATGREKWRFNARNEIQQAVFPIQAGRVYISSWHAHVYAVDIQTGAEIWRSTETDSRVSCVPYLHGDKIYYSDWRDNLYAADLATGEQVWKYEPPQKFSTGAHFFDVRLALYAGVVYFTPQADGNLYGVDAETGEGVWSLPFEGEASLDSENFGEICFITERFPSEGEGPRPAVLHCFDLAARTIRWSSPAIPGVGTPCLAEGVAYVGSTAGVMFGFDVQSGAEVWRYPASAD